MELRDRMTSVRSQRLNSCAFHQNIFPSSYVEEKSSVIWDRIVVLWFSDFAPTLYLISITTVQNNLRNCNYLLCDLSVDFRLYLNVSSEEDRESGPSDDEAGRAGPPSQFTVINYYVKSRMFCVSHQS